MATAKGDPPEDDGGRPRKRTRPEPRYCNVCAGEVSGESTGGGSCTFTVGGKVVFKSCTCGGPTFHENDNSVRPDHWPPIDDPYAYHDKRFVPRHENLIRPGKQRFECGELRGSTFVEVYSRHGFSNWQLLLPWSDSDEEQMPNTDWRRATDKGPAGKGVRRHGDLEALPALLLGDDL